MTQETLFIYENSITGETWAEVGGHAISRPAPYLTTLTAAREHAKLMGYRLCDRTSNPVPLDQGDQGPGLL